MSPDMLIKFPLTRLIPAVPFIQIFDPANLTSSVEARIMYPFELTKKLPSPLPPLVSKNMFFAFNLMFPLSAFKTKSPFLIQIALPTASFC